MRVLPVPPELAEEWNRSGFRIATGFTVPIHVIEERRRIARSMAYLVEQAELRSHPLYWSTDPIEQMLTADAAAQNRKAFDAIAAKRFAPSKPHPIHWPPTEHEADLEEWEMY